MKKLISMMFLSSVLLVKATPAFGIFPDFTPLAPVAPQLCFQCIPATISTVSGTYNVYKESINRFTSTENITKITKSFSSYLLDLGRSKFSTLMQDEASRKKVISYSRTIEDCKIAGTISDPIVVSDAFDKLFLQYPSLNSSVKLNYERKGKEMLDDGTIEMAITTREMSRELQAMLAQLDNIEKCIVAGEDCSAEGLESYNCQKENTEDELCLWRNALLAVRIYDKIMRYNEFLVSMNAQYESVRSIGDDVKIRSFEAKKEAEKQNVSSADDVINNLPSNVISVGSTIPSVYASVDTSGLFEELDDAGIRSTFEGREEEFASLAVISEAKKVLMEAVKAHNYKQILPSYLRSLKDYDEMALYHDKTIENLLTSEECIQRYLSKYYNNPGEAFLGSKCQKGAGGVYVCHYSPEKKWNDTDDFRSEGHGDTKCWDNESYACYTACASSRAETEGIYGWLRSMHKSAKVEMTVSKDSDNYMTSGYKTDLTGTVPSMSNANDSANDAYKGDNKGENTKSFKKPSVEEEVHKETRISSLLNWTVGAEAAKMIDDETINKSTTFGTITSPNKLWNDQKIFYDMYIDGKYKNMIDYVMHTPMLKTFVPFSEKINEVFIYSPVIDSATGIVTLTADQQRKETAKKLEELSKMSEDDTPISTILAKEKADLTKLTSDFEYNISELNKNKTLNYNDLDRYSSQLSDARDALNNAEDQISYSDTSTGRTEEYLEMGKPLERVKGVDYPAKRMRNQNIADNNKVKEDAELVKLQMEAKVEGLDSKINASRRRITAINQAIQTARSTYVLNYATIENKYRGELASAIEAYNTSELRKHIETLLTTNPVINVADAIEKAIRIYISNKIKEAHEEIKNLPDEELYRTGDRVVEIHNELLENLENITLEELKKDAEALSALASINEKYLEHFELAAEMFVPLVTESKKEDTEYFVGAIARARDFTTPKKPIEFRSAPLREIFHFDVEDYNAVFKSEDILVGNSFLMSGIEIPSIWREILKYRPFVEKEFDFNEFLKTHGKPEALTASSGIYPCAIDTGIVTATPNGGLALATNVATPVEKCVHLRSISSDTILDIGADTETEICKNHHLPCTEDVSLWSDNSELSQIVTYTESMNLKHLTFNESIQRAIKMLSEADKVGEDPQDTLAYYHANRVLFTTNQFGDYLTQIEISETAHQALEEISLTIKEVEDSIKNMLMEIDERVVTPDYSLRTHYEQTIDVLERYKTTKMNQVKEMIGRIVGNSESIQSNIDALKHGLKVLEKDKDEVVSITITDDLNELEEKINEALANDSVSSVYQQKGSEEFKKQIRSLQPPYCAVYF